MRDAYMPPDGYLTFKQAAVRLGVSLPKLRRLLGAGQLSAFSDPRDSRVKLVPAEDVERLSQPRPRAV